MSRTPLDHLALNAVFLQRRMGGLERYVRELVPALLALRPELRVTVFVTRAGREALATERWPENVELVAHRLLGLPYTKAVAELTVVGHLAASRRANLLHSIAMIGSIRPSIPTVVTIADVIWLREPASVPPLTRRLWRLTVPLGAKRARRVITLSEVGRREICADLGIPSDRIDVIPLGAGGPRRAAPLAEPALRRRLKLGSGPIVLAVSGLAAHKNVEVLVDALPGIRAIVSDAIVVVPGNPTDYGRALADRARKLGVGAALFLPGWVSDDVLESLYESAACLVFPSRHEGFGLPVLEAMSRGVPVVCARASALPEVAGNAALYFQPDDPFGLADAVTRVIREPAEANRLRAAGRERAASFTWEATARRTLESYERALAS